KELDEAYARATGKKSIVTPVPAGSQTGGPARLPAPPTGPVKAVVGSRQSFPEMANMATMVADEARRPAQSAEMATMAELPPAPIMPNAPQPANPNAVAGPGSATHYAVHPSHAQNAQPQAPAGMGYPVLQGGRPYSTDLAPSNLPAPQRSPYAGETTPHVDPHVSHPQQSAHLMSPVGDHYPHADWAA